MGKGEIFADQVRDGFVRMAVGNVFMDFTLLNGHAFTKSRGSYNGSRGQHDRWVTKHNFTKARVQAEAILLKQIADREKEEALAKEHSVTAIITEFNRKRNKKKPDPKPTLFGAA